MQNENNEGRLRVLVIQVHPTGLEPATLGSEDRCSDPLSYGCSTVIIASLSTILCHMLHAFPYQHQP